MSALKTESCFGSSVAIASSGSWGLGAVQTAQNSRQDQSPFSVISYQQTLRY